MFISKFLFANFLLVVLMNYFFEKRIFNFYQGRILWTSISVNDIDDEDVKKLISKGKKTLRVITIIFLLISLILLLVKTDFAVFLNVLLIFSYLGVTNFYLNSCIHKMRKLKKEKGFKVISQKFVDLKASIEINKKQLDIVTWSVPVLMYIAGAFLMYMFLEIKSYAVIITNFMILLSIIGLGLALRKTPIKVISENSEINIAVNMAKKVKLQEKVFYFSCFLVVVFTIVNYISQLDEFLMPMAIIISTVFLVIFVVYFYYETIKVERRCFEKIEDEKFVVTEDDYYDMFGYNNPDDSRIMVQNPINPTKFVINRGNRKGKIIISFFSIIISISMIFVLYLMIPSKFDVNFKEDGFKITSKMYSDYVEYSNIESIKLVDSLPKGRWIKVDGNAMDFQSYGNFKNSEVGDIRLYSFNKVEKYLEIKLKKGKTVYLNQDTLEKTLKLYEEIKEKN